MNSHKLSNYNLGEMTYAIDLAYSKGAIVKNFDLDAYNSGALTFLINKYGINATLRELKRVVKNYFDAAKMPLNSI